MKKIVGVLVLIAIGLYLSLSVEAEKVEEEAVRVSDNPVFEEIYLAGGCFWGVEGYFQRIPGVYQTEVGYANGLTDKTDYQHIKDTGHAEVLYLKYDKNTVTLPEILAHYYRIIDPFSYHKQGNDVGSQYRTGIYYTDEATGEVAKAFLEEKQKAAKEKIQIELQPLKNFVIAEDYHQDYLKKNPFGYCHIDLDLAYVPLDREVIGH